MMKKIVMIFALIIALTTSAFACPLPVDVKIQKVTTNRSDIEPALNETLMIRLRSQLRAAFSCQGEKPTRETGRNVVDVELVEIIHTGIVLTRVNIATDRGFFSALEGAGYLRNSPREQFEEALKQIAKDISEIVCK